MHLQELLQRAEVFAPKQADNGLLLHCRPSLKIPKYRDSSARTRLYSAPTVTSVPALNLSASSADQPRAISVDFWSSALLTSHVDSSRSICGDTAPRNSKFGQRVSRHWNNRKKKCRLRNGLSSLSSSALIASGASGTHCARLAKSRESSAALRAAMSAAKRALAAGSARLSSTTNMRPAIFGARCATIASSMK